MENLKQIYKQLTGVDIEEQRRIWDERGKGYYGEYLVFEKLFLKVCGNSKFLMNLNVPAPNGSTTEIDLLMIHESGIYVFEIKHYKGTIYGHVNDPRWTQYFRTAENHTFVSPISQNGYHIRALKNLFPNTPIYSVIVFTNANCVVRVVNNNPNITITTLSNVVNDLAMLPQWKSILYDINSIDSMFVKLKLYSPIRKVTIIEDGNNPVPFYDYLDLLAQHAAVEMQRLHEKIKALDEEKRINRRNLFISIFAVLLCGALACGNVANSYKEKCDKKIEIIQKELQQAKLELLDKQEAIEETIKSHQNQVDDLGETIGRFINDFVSVSEVRLLSSAFDGAIHFACTLTNTEEECGILLTEDTEYVITMVDGSEQRVAMFGERLQYSERANRLYGTNNKYAKHKGQLMDLKLSDVESVDEIKMIKITNISVWMPFLDGKQTTLAEGIELVVYSSQ